MASHNRTFAPILLVVLLAASPAILSGCGGGGATFRTTGDQTLGQELMHLQEAYEKGILSKKDYNDTKQRLIKKYLD